jgi:hypothetical protein
LRCGTASEHDHRQDEYSEDQSEGQHGLDTVNDFMLFHDEWI